MGDKGYNSAASFYDRLSRLVFGSTLLQAQRWLVQHIPASSRILVVGGGTGIILENIAAVHNHGLSIDYVELAPRMMARARKRRCGRNQVTFTEAAVQDVDFAIREYDVVITPFVFDSFTDSELQVVFSTIGRVLARDGKWLYCDFVDTGKPWHRALLWSMYRFFGLLGSVEVYRLPDVGACFKRHHYKTSVSLTFMKGFVESVIYERR